MQYTYIGFEGSKPLSNYKLPSDIPLVVLDMVLELCTLVTASMFGLLLGKFSWDLVPVSIYHLSVHASTVYQHQLSWWAIYNSIKFNLGMDFGAPETHQNEATPTQAPSPAAMSWPGSDGGIDWVLTDPSAQSLSFLWFLPNLKIRKKYVINSFLRGTEKL